MANLSWLKLPKVKHWIYPIFTFAYVLVALLIFVSASRYLFEQTNRPFSLDSEAVAGELPRLNLDNFNLVAKKLNINLENSAEAEAADDLNSESENDEEAPVPALLKTDLAIAVFNSTRTGGLANNLKTDLIGAGFNVARVGNLTETEPATLIKIKTSLVGAETLLTEIEQIVSQKYEAERQALEADSLEDIQIIIGAN